MGVGGGGRKEHTGGPDKGKQKSGTRAGSGPSTLGGSRARVNTGEAYADANSFTER